jgi:hypothetical protein
MPKNYKNSWKVYLLNKRQNFYICSYYQKMRISIFPMFFSFYGTYTKSFIIFGSAHDLLHKIKHNSKTAQKEKEKQYCAASGREIGPQAGPFPFGPRARRAGCPPPLSAGH